MSISDAELDEMMKRCEAATPGPFVSTDTSANQPQWTIEQATTGVLVADFPSEDDADFWVTARADLPYVIKALREANQINLTAAKDWAEDDTAIRELCRPFTDVEGNSYAVPMIVEVVERIVKALKIAQSALVLSEDQTLTGLAVELAETETALKEERANVAELCATLQCYPTTEEAVIKIESLRANLESERQLITEIHDCDKCDLCEDHHKIEGTP
jgi:hypothetical protein